MITLYDYELSGNCYKVRLLLRLLKVPFTAHPMDFHPGREHKSEWFLKLNPLGQLPVIDDAGFILREAQAILVYLASRYDPTGHWYPFDDAAQLGRISQWLGFADSLTATAAAARRHDTMFVEVDIHKARSGAHALLRILDEHLWFTEQTGASWLCSAERPDDRGPCVLPLRHAVRGRRYFPASLSGHPSLGKSREGSSRLHAHVWHIPMNIIRSLPLVLAVAGVLLSAAVYAAQAEPERRLVIFDQDTDEIIGDNTDPLVMLLQAPNIKVLGVTVVTGNGWLKQETATVLKLLEDLHRTDIPVYMGAEFPLVQSRFTPVRLLKLYGGNRTDAYLGAYGETSPGPDVVVPPPGGLAKYRPAEGPAASFIIQQVHLHPHEVTLYCGGALTNVALAIRLDPSIVALTREIVFMGTSPSMQPKTVNVVYDPESASIVLHAPWPKLTLITVDLAEKLHKTLAMSEAIAAGRNTAEAQLYEELVMKPYRAHAPMFWFRMPDELEAAYLIDPTLITSWRRYYVDVDTMMGMNYGASNYWDEFPKGYGGGPWPDNPGPKAQKPTPSPDARVADVGWDFDTERFTALFLKLMTEPMRGAD